MSRCLAGGPDPAARAAVAACCSWTRRVRGCQRGLGACALVAGRSTAEPPPHTHGCEKLQDPRGTGLRKASELTKARGRRVTPSCVPGLDAAQLLQPQGCHESSLNTTPKSVSYYPGHQFSMLAEYVC